MGQGWMLVYLVALQARVVGEIRSARRAHMKRVTCEACRTFVSRVREGGFSERPFFEVRHPYGVENRLSCDSR